MSRETPWPGSLTGEPLPEVYSHLLDMTVSLAMAAAVTTRLRLGTSVALLAARDPLWTAKEYATLDVLSGGRVEFGVGFGWNREELRNHGVTFEQRWDHTREAAMAIRALWADDEASFDGDHVSFTPSWAWPKPVQSGGPKIHIGGGAGPRLLGHVAEWADGWLPISARSSIADRLRRLDEACDRVGRDRTEIDVSVFGATTDPAGPREPVRRRCPPRGTHAAEPRSRRRAPPARRVGAADRRSLKPGERTRYGGRDGVSMRARTVSAIEVVLLAAIVYHAWNWRAASTDVTTTIRSIIGWVSAPIESTRWPR